MNHTKQQKLTDEEVVAPMVIEFYHWLSDNQGTHPDELLSRDLTPSQRRMLLDKMDDVTVLWGLTSSERRAARVREAQRQVAAFAAEQHRRQ